MKNEFYFNEEIYEEIANAYVPDEDNFIPTPLATASQQRNSAVRELTEQIKMPAFTSQLQVGVETIQSGLISLPKEQSDQVTVIFESIVNGLTQENISFEKEGQDPASLLNLSDEGLDIIAHRAMYYLDKQEWEKACGIYSLLVLLKPSNANYWFQRALSLFFANSFEESEISVEAAIEINPNQPEFYLLQASALFSQNERNLSQKSFKKALQLINAYSLTLDEIWKEWSEDIAIKLRKEG